MPRASRRARAPGARRPWMMEHPLQVGECIGCGICIRECPPNVMSLVTLSGERAARALGRVRSTARPRLRPTDGSRCRRSPARRSSPSTTRRGATCSPGGRGRGAKAWQVWTSMVDERDRRSTRSLPGGVPGRHRRRAVCGPDRGRPLRRGVRGRRRGQSVPVGVRLDLHRAVRGRMPSGRAGRTDRDPDAQALRGRARQAARGRAADGRAAPRGWRSSAAGRPACPRPSTWPASDTPSPSSRRCPCRAA